MKKLIIHYIVIASSILSFLISFFPLREVSAGYGLLWMQPLTFAVIYVFVLTQVIKTKRYKITTYSYIFLAWLRFVSIPLLSSISGNYNGVSYLRLSIDSIQLAVLLAVWELIFSSIFLYFITITRSNRYLINEINTIKLELKGNKLIYFVFILLAILLYITIGRNLNLINFFFISIDTAERFSDITSTPLVLLRQIFKVSMIFFFVWFTSYCYKKYSQNTNKKYFYYAIIVGLINVGVIIGERRSEQLYTSLVVIFILTKTFSKFKKEIIFLITSSAGVILFLMSIYKHFSAFYYGSYIDALQLSSINLDWFTLILQSYFFGTQNVAAAIQLNDVLNFDLINMLYDFGRSLFGLSFFLKDLMIMTTEHFNTFIYGFSRASGHVMSGVGYGYIYLGAILSPLIVCLNIYLSIKLEKWFIKTESFEIKYISGYMLVRFCTNIFVNTPPLISLSTIMLFTAGLVYFVAKLFKKEKKLKMHASYLNDFKIVKG